MNSRWLSDGTLSVSGAGRDFAVGDMRVSRCEAPCRTTVVLCTSCGLEILARTLESLSLRVPVRNSLVSKNEKPLFAVRPEKHIIVQKKTGRERTLFMTPMLIQSQARPIIRNTRLVSITPLRRKSR